MIFTPAETADFLRTADAEDTGYTVRYSQRQASWYVADASGECVSSLYDTEEEAAADYRGMIGG
jgi:hypothetical protein